MSRDKAIQVECVKVAMTQDRNGYFLRLALHPSDDVTPLVNCPVGSRFMAAFVEINEHQQAMTPRTVAGPPKHDTQFNRYVTQAVLLCREEMFQSWMVKNGYAQEESEEGAKSGLYKFLEITSRGDLARVEFSEAREKWQRLYNNFVADQY